MRNLGPASTYELKLKGVQACSCLDIGCYGFFLFFF